MFARARTVRTQTIQQNVDLQEVVYLLAPHWWTATDHAVCFDKTSVYSLDYIETSRREIL